jgi:DNA-3-methyladenine glycosylase I
MFEILVLEGAQAGLSWGTILRKRENFRRAFDHFDPFKVSHYDEKDVGRLLSDPGIVRNEAKIRSSINNAKELLSIQKQFESFSDHLWSFVGGKPCVNQWRRISEIPAITKQSIALSKDLKARGFKFVGPTICYSHMQATGMVNDHLVDCFRYSELGGTSHL